MCAPGRPTDSASGMLLELTLHRAPAEDLGWLLYKHPDRHTRFSLSYGHADVFWPVLSPDTATCALLMTLDPIALVRGRSPSESGPLAQYVNDRPYVASSFLAVAINRAFRTAIAGRCDQRPELVDEVLPLSAALPTVRSKGGASLVRRLFEPLGYTVNAHPVVVDEESARLSAWSGGSVVSVRLEGRVTVRDLLRHLVVLLPVLDDDKHYWVDASEVDTLLARGTGWLEDHPEKPLITRRSLKHRKALTRQALEQLVPEADDYDEPEQDDPTTATPRLKEHTLEAPLRLQDRRLRQVCSLLVEHRPQHVVDLGCGEGGLLALLLKKTAIPAITGVDVSVGELARARRKLRLDDQPPGVRERLNLVQGSAVYVDPRLHEADAVSMVEVIEHIDEERLPLLERAVFGTWRPHLVVVTTPNVEYNTTFEQLAAGRLRHADHRFEWTRAQFAAWADRLCRDYGYRVSLADVGDPVEPHRPPTQLARLGRDRSGVPA